MAEEESQPLAYVHETVLKRRKNNEEWAIKRREQLDARKKRKKEDLKLAIRRPEEFVKEYRDKVRILLTFLWCLVWSVWPVKISLLAA